MSSHSTPENDDTTLIAGTLMTCQVLEDWRHSLAWDFGKKADRARNEARKVAASEHPEAIEVAESMEIVSKAYDALLPFIDPDSASLLYADYKTQLSAQQEVRKRADVYEIPSKILEELEADRSKAFVSHFAAQSAWNGGRPLKYTRAIHGSCGTYLSHFAEDPRDDATQETSPSVKESILSRTQAQSEALVKIWQGGLDDITELARQKGDIETETRRDE